MEEVQELVWEVTKSLAGTSIFLLLWTAPEFHSMSYALAGGSVMKLEIDDSYELYEKITENQANWPTDKDFPKKVAACIILTQ